MPELSLVLPVVDEEDIITGVVADITSLLTNESIDFEIILVENESKDNTLSVIEKLARKDKRIKVARTKRGYGSAVLAGLKIANGCYVSYMPSDGQIDASILGQLWQEIKKDKYDLVKIKRLNRESFPRFLRSKMFNLLARLLFAIDIRDINGSPRIFRRNKLPVLDLSYLDSFIDTEFAVKAHLLGWKIKEIPMRNLERKGGKTTVNIGTILEFLKNFLIFRRGDRLKKWQYLWISKQ